MPRNMFYGFALYQHFMQNKPYTPHFFRLFFTFIFVLITLPLCIFAQEETKGHFEINTSLSPDSYRFWIYTPADYTPNGHPLPLVIFLHGASLCGHDINKVRRYGVLDAIDKGKIIPTLVIAPQNSGGAWSPSKLNKLLEWTTEHYAVDTNRVYVLGMSLGGYGTMDFVCAYPNKVAAAMALCGGCSAKDVSPLGKVPLWIIHGTNDRAVSIKQSQRVVESLEQEGNNKLLRYTWLQGGNHGLPARLFYLQKTYDWLFTHSLKDNPRSVATHFDITPQDIRETYIELRMFSRYYNQD